MTQNEGRVRESMCITQPSIVMFQCMSTVHKQHTYRIHTQTLYETNWSACYETQYQGSQHSNKNQYHRCAFFFTFTITMLNLHVLAQT